MNRQALAKELLAIASTLVGEKNAGAFSRGRAPSKSETRKYLDHILTAIYAIQNQARDEYEKENGPTFRHQLTDADTGIADLVGDLHRIIDRYR